MKYLQTILLFSALLCTAELPEQFINNAKKYTNDIKSVIPQKLQNGQNGYLIITTSQIADNSKLLPKFINQKQKAGFKLKVITEADYGESEAQEKAANIRQWLQNNYQTHNAIYVLLLGSPHPFNGDIPHQLVRRGQAEGAYSIKTDYTYSDLTGVLDPNGDKNVCDEKKDINHPYGPDGIADIFVGRVPFSDIGKIDNYFKELIKFENESQNLVNRHNALLVSQDKMQQQKWNRVKHEFITPLNARSFTISDGDDGWVQTPQITELNSKNVVDTINKYNFGFIGFPNNSYAYGLINTLQVKEKDSINSTKRAGITYIGDCDAAHPERNQNISKVILEKISIGVFSGTSALKNKKRKSIGEDFGFYNLAASGWSNGEILARYNSKLAEATKKSPNICYNITLFGDPSVISMPELKAEKRTNPKSLSTKKSLIKFTFDQSAAGFKRKVVTYCCGGKGCQLFDLKVVEGKFNKAMQFNGLFNEYGGAVSVKRYPDALRDDYHVSFWIKLDEDVKNCSLIQKEDSWNIAVVDEKLVFEFYQNSFDKDYVVKTVTEGVHFNQHYWNKIELKIDRSKELMTGWLNGKMVSKAKIKAKLPSGSENIIMIGKDCQGLIDELKINNFLK